MSRLPSIPVIAVPAMLLALLGCASARPVPDLVGSRTLISQAEQSDAPQFASADLESARSKVRQADEDARQGKTVLATRLAHEAAVDAEVAMARTRALKAEQALRDVNAGTQTLRNESLRQGEIQQSAPSGGAVIVVPDTTREAPPTPVQR
jgi:hypothetical protein